MHLLLLYFPCTWTFLPFCSLSLYLQVHTNRRNKQLHDRMKDLAFVNSTLNSNRGSTRQKDHWKTNHQCSWGWGKWVDHWYCAHCWTRTAAGRCTSWRKGIIITRSNNTKQKRGTQLRKRRKLIPDDEEMQSAASSTDSEDENHHFDMHSPSASSSMTLFRSLDYNYQVIDHYLCCPMSCGHVAVDTYVLR